MLFIYNTYEYIFIISSINNKSQMYLIAKINVEIVY